MVNGQICKRYNCHHCCIETEMLLTKKDIKTITKHTGIKPEKYVRVTEDEFKMLKNSKHADKKTCFFLNEKGFCEINDIKPEGCQFYPLIWDFEYHKAVKDDYCPYWKEFNPSVDELKSIELFILKLFGRL